MNILGLPNGMLVEPSLPFAKVERHSSCAEKCEVLMLTGSRFLVMVEVLEMDTTVDALKARPHPLR